MQFASIIAPVVSRYLQATQLVQSAGLISGLYLPGAHRAHVWPLGPVAPWLHVQLDSAELLAGPIDRVGQGSQTVEAGIAEFVPTQQVLHSVAGAVSEYLPKGQSMQVSGPSDARATCSSVRPIFPSLQVHGPPGAPEKPSMHTQLVTAVLPAGETEFARHAAHAPADMYWFAAHDCGQTHIPFVTLSTQVGTAT